MTDSWKEWNLMGLIPGPDESEAAFNERVTYCLQLKDTLGKDFPFTVEEEASQLFLEEAFPVTEKIYGIAPRWVPMVFSNRQLTPWHGGCAWIFRRDSKTPMGAFLQLRKAFHDSSTFLGFYQRKELIAHEIAHVGRMVNEEPQFEELLAYQCSSSSLRRWLGPIVQSSKESLLFILFLCFSVVVSFILLISPDGYLTTILWAIQLIPFLLIAAALGRLGYRHRLFKCCLKNLSVLYPQPEIAGHLLYRLRDFEIRQFAHFTPSQICDFINASEKSSFRWRFLKSLYAP